MYRFDLASVIFLVLIFSASCRKENRCDCLKGTGEVIQEERTAGEFSEIISYQDVNVILTPDTVNRIAVEAGENLLPLIETEIENNVLSVRNRNKCNWVRSFKNVINVYVSVKDLQKVAVRGAGSFSSTDTIKANDFTSDVWSSGDISLLLNAGTTHTNIHANVGDITLKGKSGVSYIHSAGNGHMHLENLIADYTFLRNKGTGDCYVNVIKELSAEILHVGNVYYRGSPPVISSDIRGSGKLIRQ